MSTLAPRCGDLAQEEGTTNEIGAALSILEPTAAVGTIDAQFQVDPSGAANYKIPIVVPPGINGVEPKLALGYKSSNRNGPLGMGFSISGIPTITRCPRTVAQDGVRSVVKGDANDRFCLDGQRLIGMSGTYGANNSQYRTEIESYSKVINKLDFGFTGNSTSYFDDGSTVNVWGTSKFTDLHENYLTVDHFVDNNQLYPLQIIYTRNDVDPMLSLRTVTFEYDSTRTDKEFAFVGGDEDRDQQTPHEDPYQPWEYGGP